MGKQVTVKAGYTDVILPKVFTVPVNSSVSGQAAGTQQVLGYGGYNGGDTVVLTNAEYSALTTAQLSWLGSPTTVAEPARPSADTKAIATNVVASATGTQTLQPGFNVLTLTGATTLALAGFVAGSYSVIRVLVAQDATGSRALTQVASVVWYTPAGAAGSAPTMTATASKRDLYEYWSVDGGTTVFGHIVFQNV